MFGSGKTKVSKEEFQGSKKPITFLGVDVNKVISKLIESKNLSK